MGDCLFCRIGKKEISSKMVYEDEFLFAIRDINPQAPVHLLIIPKKHIAQINDLAEADSKLAGNLILLAKRLAVQEKIEEGFRLVFNNGSNAGQSVFHVHLHLMGGRKMTWPPG